LNARKTKITQINALSEYDFDPIESTNASNPTVVYDPYIENVAEFEITLLKTSDKSVPSGIRLAIHGCADPTPLGTKAQIETTIAGQTGGTTSGRPGQATTTMRGGAATTTISGQTSTTGTGRSTGSTSGVTGTTGRMTGTTTKQCAEMQAVDDRVSKQILTQPKDVPQGDKVNFQVTSPRGVSFPESEKTPKIIITFGQPAEVQSVTIPRDKTPEANVQRFEVTFFAPDGKKINDKPILSSTSPKDDKRKPAQVALSQIPSDKRVSRVEVTVVKTTDKKSPKGVVLDIKACTKSTTGELRVFCANKHSRSRSLSPRHNTCWSYRSHRNNRRWSYWNNDAWRQWNHRRWSYWNHWSHDRHNHEAMRRNASSGRANQQADPHSTEGRATRRQGQLPSDISSWCFIPGKRKDTKDHHHIRSTS
jgi:hypothetical protein